MANFGTLKELIIESTIEEKLLETQPAKKTAFRGLVKMLRESAFMRDLYYVHTNLEDSRFTDEAKAQQFLEENLRLFREKYPAIKSLSVPNAKVRSLLEGKEIPTSTPLSESIEYLLTHKKKLSNLPQYDAHMERVKAHLMREEVAEPLQENLTISGFNEKYAEQLTEEGKEIFNILLEGDESLIAEKFEKVKGKTLEVINDSLHLEEDKEVKRKLMNVRDKIREMSASAESLLKLHNLKEELA